MTTITINRAVVEQALEALTAHADLHGTMYLKMDAITAFKAALAQQAEPVEPVDVADRLARHGIPMPEGDPK